MRSEPIEGHADTLPFYDHDQNDSQRDSQNDSRRAARSTKL